MVEVLLHLWRGSSDYSQDDSYFGMVQQGSQDDASISVRGNGTFERFILRILDNTSTSLVTLDFLLNGVVQPNSRIQIISSGETGIFLPISQLPQPFFKDDLLVLRLTGLTGGPPPGGLVRGEISFDLKFTS